MTMEDLDLDAIPSTVCVPHKRFIPCRGDIAECRWSTEPEDVAMVRWYQRGTDKE